MNPESTLRCLVMVRHGETAGQSSTRYHGITDVPLNALGRAQMASVAAALAGVTFDLVLTSTLQRTVAAAAIIAPAVPARALAEFDEINFGDWEGLTREEIAHRDPVRYAEWLAALGVFTYPNGDAVQTFRERVSSAWRALAPALPARVLLVAHKGIIATILSDLLQLTPAERAALRIDLASIHVVRPAHGQGWVADAVNDVRHLGGLS